MIRKDFGRYLRSQISERTTVSKASSSNRRKRYKPSRRLAIECLENRLVMATMPIISEFLASNSDGLRDSDGESSDWIEIYNPTSQPVDLNGWRLTDSLGDLNQWTFPTLVLAPNDFATVFASGKNRAVAGQQLHTNFRLSSDGEYLALVTPQGTIASEYAPSYALQATNVSFGTRFDTQTLITTGSNAKSLVPNNNTLGNSWTTSTFADASWASTPVGIGFGVVEPGFDVTYYKSNIEVNDVTGALNIISNPANQTFAVSSRVPVVNYMGNGGGGHYGDDEPFPTQSIGDDINDFIIKATTQLTIPTAGDWSFGVNSDDGFRLTLSRNGIDYVVEYPFQRGPSDTVGTLNLPQAGEYSATLIMFERAGGASVELFAAQGAYGSWDNTNFDLIGDVTNGGIQASVPVSVGPNSPLRSDISSVMLGVNSTAYVRVPFTVTNASSFDSLRLRMRYDDGFVAYINGIEVARRNAPASLAFDSAATTDISSSQSEITEDINISSFLSALQNGNNVLAIQGLNSSPSDSSFFVLPELVASQLFANDYRYFATPTPNAPNLDAALGIVQSVVASVPAGFYDAPVAVALSTPTASATIRYTLDGSTPTSSHGTVYANPIPIASTKTLRAIAYIPGYVSLPSITRSYLFLDDVIQQSALGQPPIGWPSTWGANVVDYGMDPDIIALEGATAVKNALKAIPSLSITTDLANLFDPVTGIYANSWNDGRDWERPASLELLNTNANPGFQVNAGLRIRGGYSRSTDNPKHSFRLFFRGEYGDSTLDYPMFGPSTPSLKKLDLRTAQNYSWSFGGDPSNNFVTDIFNRQTQAAMGMPSTRSEWYHLYLNGQYWGLYQTQERAEAEFAASYLGGLAINYDVIKPEAGPYANYATDGNQDAWFRLWTAISQNVPNTTTPAVVDNGEYLKLQGKNPDQTDNAGYEVLLDVDNLIVYMINILYGGNLDAPISAFLGNQRVNNFFAVRDRTSRQGFKFFLHDSEHTLRDVNENRNGPWPAGEQFDYFNPQWLHQRLMANTEYRMRFADIVQKSFFYDGALSTATAQSRFNAEAAKIDLAIIAESARWGDAKRPDDPLKRSDWLNAVTGVVGGYMPIRGPVVINQFRQTTLDGTTPAPLFPSIDAPTFIVNNTLQHGGVIAPNSTLRFGASTGLVYYTTDGSDPRMFGGGINPNAMVFDPQPSVITAVPTNSSWKYRDNGVDLGSAWRASNFDDSAWASGNAELGYGDNDEATVVSYGPNPNNKYITTYFRKSFNVADVSSVSGLALRLKRDDGAVVYINGVEATRSNMPTGDITAATLAASAVGGADESTFYSFSVNPGLLVNGTNVIAIEVHQSSASSSDLSFDAELTVTLQASPPLNLGLVPSNFKARTRLSTGEWSAIEQASFSVPLVPAAAGNLAVTEIHYNPVAYTGANASLAPFNDPQNFEFIELRNKSEDVISLDGVSFVGITYTFPTSTNGPVTWLLPGQSIVVVKNQQAFAARYLNPGSPYLGIKIAPGDYGTSNLSNGGEGITVLSATSTVIQDFVYDDIGAGWPGTTDGGGPSLTVVRTTTSLYNNASNWRASFVLHGTPGIEENDAPVSITLSNASVVENSAGALVGIVSADDPDDRDTLTYSIGVGNDGALFAIVGNQLRVGSVPLNFETGATKSVVLKTTDSAGASLSQTFVVSIINENDPPVPNIGGPYSPVEGVPLQLNGSVTDEDANQSWTYEWDFDYDGSVFTVDSVLAAPTVTYSDNASRTIALRVTDNGTPVKNATVSTGLLIANAPPTVQASSGQVSGNVLSTLSNAGTWNDVAADTVTLSASLGTVTKNANGTWSWSLVPSQKIVNQVVTISATDEDGGASNTTFVINALTAVTNQRVFYNGSGYEANGGLVAALDSGKALLRSQSTSQTTSYTNVSNYLLGINGLILDVAGLVGTTLSAADFTFRKSPIGASGTVNPSTWPSAPNPNVINVIPGNATTAARVVLEWPNNAIQNSWLQIVVKANANTGLVDRAVYYIGHALGEVDGASPYRVSTTDVGLVRSAVSNAIVAVSDPRDIDKDRRVTTQDVGALRARVSNTVLIGNITVPPAGSASEGEDDYDANSFDFPLTNVSQSPVILARQTSSLYWVDFPLSDVSNRQQSGNSTSTGNGFNQTGTGRESGLGSPLADSMTNGVAKSSLEQSITSRAEVLSIDQYFASLEVDLLRKRLLWKK